MKKTLIALAALGTLAGCGTPGTWQNRVTTTLDCQRGFVSSLYGPVGITTEIAAADVQLLPCAARDRKPAAPAAGAGT